MTEFLSQNKIRLQLAEKFLINFVKVPSSLAHLVIQLTTAMNTRVNRGLRQHGPPQSFRRIIAFVRYGNNLLPKSQCEYDFGGTGQEGTDSQMRLRFSKATVKRIYLLVG